MPDLVIIDGGKGQVAAAKEVLDELGLHDLPVAGLAKEREELFLPGASDPIVLPPTSSALYMIQRLRDEAHRFAITYHRDLRSKRQVHSAFDDLPGVGPKRRRALLRVFGSAKRVREAPVEQIAAVPGIGASLAATDQGDAGGLRAPGPRRRPVTVRSPARRPFNSALVGGSDVCHRSRPTHNDSSIGSPTSRLAWPRWGRVGPPPRRRSLRPAPASAAPGWPPAPLLGPASGPARRADVRCRPHCVGSRRPPRPRRPPRRPVAADPPNPDRSPISRSSSRAGSWRGSAGSPSSSARCSSSASRSAGAGSARRRASSSASSRAPRRCSRVPGCSIEAIGRRPRSSPASASGRGRSPCSRQVACTSFIPVDAALAGYLRPGRRNGRDRAACQLAGRGRVRARRHDRGSTDPGRVAESRDGRVPRRRPRRDGLDQLPPVVAMARRCWHSS